MEAPPGLDRVIPSAARSISGLPSEGRAAPVAASGAPPPSFIGQSLAEQDLKDQLIKQVTDAVREHMEARTAAAVENVLARGQRAMQHLQQQQMMQMEHLQGQLAACVESYRSLERENAALKVSLESLMKHLTLVLGPPPCMPHTCPAPPYYPQSPPRPSVEAAAAAALAAIGILPPQASGSVGACAASAGLPVDGAPEGVEVPWAGDGSDLRRNPAGVSETDAAPAEVLAGNAPKPQVSTGVDDLAHAVNDQVDSLETAPCALSPKARECAAADFVPQVLAPAAVLGDGEAAAGVPGSADTPPCPKVVGAGRKRDMSSPATTASASSAASPSTVGGRSPPELGSSPTGSALPAAGLAPVLPTPRTMASAPLSAAWPRSGLAASAVPTFTLTLRRADNVPLGLDVRGEPGERCLVVEAIRTGGAVEAWNRLCAGDSREMRVGDHIMAINGAEDVDAMHQECLTKHLLRMTVARASKANPPTPQTSSPYALATPAARSTSAPAATPGGTLRVEAHEFVPQAGASWPA
eukprot:CAMPEP_0176044376 /NCGR_PEP_ID=MMETSP0120_2-20121206/22025_1 /TAXON_ID=160619 /ORGANISM="Kryptoperidinium foliaceum, Strain CCMP 1326" /LENGTH=525 /DNA_ID=CAMNT_0017377783 /DNA_START=71 /DNA_END=1648 /DNA_ORIENTATION=-